MKPLSIQQPASGMEWTDQVAELQSIGEALVETASRVTTVQSWVLSEPADLPFITADGSDTTLEVNRFDPERLLAVEHLSAVASYVIEKAVGAAESSTQFGRLKGIKPHVPSLRLLRPHLMHLKAGLHPPRRKDGILVPAINPEQPWPHAHPVELGRGCVESALTGIGALESVLGNFNIISERPRWDVCESLARALTDREHDAEDFLDFFLRSELRSANAKLLPHVAIGIWGATFWHDLAEGVIYHEILHRAVGALREERSCYISPIQLTDEYGRIQTAEPLNCDIPQANEVLLLLAQNIPFPLLTLSRKDSVADPTELFNHFGLSAEERQYAELQKLDGRSRTEIMQLLGWPAARVETVRRNVNRKILKTFLREGVPTR